MFNYNIWVLWHKSNCLPTILIQANPFLESGGVWRIKRKSLVAICFIRNSGKDTTREAIMSRYPAKGHVGICAYWRLRSACASAVRSEFPKSALRGGNVLTFLSAENKDSDQTMWMHRQIWVFAVRIFQLVPYTGYRLNYIVLVWLRAVLYNF